MIVILGPQRDNIYEWEKAMKGKIATSILIYIEQMCPHKWNRKSEMI